MIDPLIRAKRCLWSTYPTNIIPIGWRFALFGILLENDRLIREQMNSKFLLECRRQQKIPKFITNYTQHKMPNTQHQSNYQKVTHMFQKKILNLTIRDSFRKIANIEKSYNERLLFIRKQPDRLRSERTIKQAALDFIEVYNNQVEAVHIRDKKSKQENKLMNLPSYKEIRDKPPTYPTRVTFLGDVDLSTDATTLLSKGPNFAVQNNSKKALKRKELEAEVSIERYAYGVRWANKIRDSGAINTMCTDRSRFKINDPENHKTQPPPLKTHMDEQKLKDAKVQILAEYKKCTLSPPLTKNLTKQENEALKELKKRDDIIIKPSDKDKQFVVAPKSMYIEHVEKSLSDQNTYKKVTKNPLPMMKNDINSLCDHLSAKYPTLAEEVKPHLPRIPELYCNYKTHKDTSPPPLRPVTSQIDAPTAKLGQVTNYILNQALKFVPVNLKDSTSLRHKLKNKYNNKVEEGHILATADVKSLYTNVPLEHGVDVVSKFILEHIKDIDMLGLEYADFVLILKTVVQAGYFRFNDSYYQQIDGLGMGVKPAPSFAIIYVYCTVEKPLIENDYTYTLVIPDKPTDIMSIDSWDRYVDDCLMVGKGDQQDVENLFTYVNQLNPHIQFTHESSHHKIDFLDLTIHLDVTTKCLEFELYTKPSSLGIFLNFHSAHPQSTIRNSAISELNRALQIGSTEQLKKNGIEKISRMLKDNAFPNRTIEELIDIAKKKTDSTKSDTQDVRRNYLCLPYIGEQHKRRVYYILRTNGLLTTTQVTFRPDRKLKQILTRSALQHTPCNKQSDAKCYQCDEMCMTKNVVYLLTCNLCSEQYVGESGRYKRNRCWEHYKSVRDMNNTTAMGRHYQLCHSNVPKTPSPFMFEVLKRCVDYTDRMLWQSLYIKHLSPTINTQLSDDVDSWNKVTWGIM